MKIKVVLEGEDYNRLTFIFDEWPSVSTFVKYAIKNSNGPMKVTVEEYKEEEPFA